MRTIFNYDNFLNQALVKVADCMLLSLLWLIGSLPVITISASSTAMYYTVNKCVRGNRSGVLKAFLESFRTNCKQAIVLGLILFPLFLLLLAGCYGAYVMYLTGSTSKALPIFVAVLFVLISMWTSYLFPYLARFNDSNKRVLTNCAWIALFNFHWSILLVVLFAAAIIAVLAYPLCIFLVPGVYMLFSSYIIERIFRRYMSPEDLEKECGYGQKDK